MHTKADTDNGTYTVYRLNFELCKRLCGIITKIQFLLKYLDVGKRFIRWKTVCTSAILFAKVASA